MSSLLVFIDLSVEIQSVMLVCSTQLYELLPLQPPLLFFSGNKLRKCKKFSIFSYIRVQFATQMNTEPQIRLGSSVVEPELEPRAEEPKLNCIPELEPKSRIAVLPPAPTPCYHRL
jgi:hypothetical protein